MSRAPPPVHCTPALSPGPFGDLRDWRWYDGERLVRFGDGALAEAPELIAEKGYTLLVSGRSREFARALEPAAGTVSEVGAGRVDELAGDLRAHLQGELIVAVGGGRVIDTAKALAAADPRRRVAAIPTSLSGAEMTRFHRQARGAPLRAPVRPSIVINDPLVSASQPAAELAASAANALAHALEGPLTHMASPVAALAGARAAALIDLALGEPPLAIPQQPSAQNRADLALAALLAGYAVDACGLGLHHVLCQTLVRITGVGHGEANAAMLPHTLIALERRRPQRLAELGAGLRGPAVGLARTLAARAGALRLRDLGVAEQAIADCVQAAQSRAELALIPPPAMASELRALYLSAW